MTMKEKKDCSFHDDDDDDDDEKTEMNRVFVEETIVIV